MQDPFDLNRFVAAQESVYKQVCLELTAGAKTTHWMWFVFPQLEVLGRSAMARRYGVKSREEAAAYLGHAVLGPRLVNCTRSSMRFRPGRCTRSLVHRTT